MRRRVIAPMLVGCVLAITTGCSDDKGGLTAEIAAECNPLGGSLCVFPWPSSIYAVDDSTTDTGRRLDVPVGAMPDNADGFVMDTAFFNTRDGFSTAAPMLMAFDEGVSAANLVSFRDYAKSLTDESPTVIIDMETGERVAHFAELDAPAEDTPEQQALYLRPAVRLKGSHRYAVAIRKSLKAKNGSDLPISAGFQALLDDTTTDHELLERTRSRYPAIFTALENQGISKDDLVVAWDFTTASDASMRADVLDARERAYAQMGVDGANQTFTVESDEAHGDKDIARRIEGTYQAPLFLTNDGRAQPGTFLARSSDGKPEYQGMYDAPFTAIIPECALSSPEPVGMMLYGHGLLGTGSQAASGSIRRTAAELCRVVIGTDMRGMAEGDLTAVARALNNFNHGREIFETLVQGVINHIALTNIMRGPMANSLFVDGSGASLVNPDDIVYYGLSQGHIFGSTHMAYDKHLKRGVVGVGGINYSMMLERSVDWPTYKTILIGAYPDPLQVSLMISLMQMAWDLTDPVQVANDLLDNTAFGGPTKQLLIHMATGDEEVPNISTEYQARTMGLPVLGPAMYEIYGVPEATGPVSSALVIYDEGGLAGIPLTNTPPPDTDAHYVTRDAPAALRQMKTFYTTGEILHECGTTPCYCLDGACD